MPGRTVLLVLACLLFDGGLTTGQQTSVNPDAGQSSTLSVTVKVVNVPATVRDKHGQIISNLSKDDFILEEDGRPQTIHYFAHDTDLPLTLGLLVDTSLSQRRVLESERHASYVFLDQMLRQSKDTAFIIHFDREVELLQDLTSARDKLESSLQSLQVAQADPAGGQSGGAGGNNGPTGAGYPGGRGGGHRRHSAGGGGTLLYDAAYLASDEIMKKQQGRKAVIILSDGVDTGSKLTLATAIEAAQRADTIVYSILFADDEAYGEGFRDRGGFGGMGRRGGYPRPQQEPRPDGKKILEQIAKQTGGRLFEVSKKHPIDKIYGSIAEELRNQYSLGYTPDRANQDVGYHRISLKTKQKDLAVQAREGYYADR
ncbi:MAG: VWA domain-containing protein [Candidatus Angelobacter sp.]